MCAAATAAQFIPHSPFGFDRGQDVAPTFDGWVGNPDGTYSLYFGYVNRNIAEDLHIPVGPNNTVEPGGDRGQPTYFYQSGRQDPTAALGNRSVMGRRRWFAFRVDVPHTWTPQERLVWTLTSRGRTNRAVGWLQPEYEVTTEFVSDSVGDGHLFVRGDFDEANHPPTVSGAASHTVALPATATLTITSTDDGRPQPSASPATTRRAPPAPGLRVRWITYRGPARVAFSQATDGPLTTSPATFNTTATFSEPGLYWLRAKVTDGQLLATRDIEVMVNPAPSAQAGPEQSAPALVRIQHGQR